MEFNNQEYEMVEIGGDADVIREHPQNPKRGDIDLIQESIDVNGWYGAITVQRSTGYILAGNHRYRVAVANGARLIPVIYVDVDDETASKILLVDNKSADAGTYDEAVLEELLAGLETLDGTGYVFASAQEKLDAASGESSGDPPPAGGGSAEEEPVPADKHEPQWAVIVQCKSERQQEETYRWLVKELPKRAEQIRLTAI